MALLQVHNLTVNFGGLRAVHDFNLVIEPGQIRGLIGPNGAGKTTVFNLITGIHQPTEGTITLDGRSVVGLQPYQIAAMGIARMNALGEDPAETSLEAILADQRKSIEEASEAVQTALKAAEKVAELALEENYGPGELERIMDGLSDHELRKIIETIELGAMPADFFPSPGTRPKPAITAPSGTSPEKPSSSPAIPAPTSKVAK